MKYPLNIYLQIIGSWDCEISTHKVAKILLLGTEIHYTKFLANMMCWKWSFSAENGRKSRILRMKHPSKIFLHKIASWYQTTSTHKVAKNQLSGTKFHYT